MSKKIVQSRRSFIRNASLFGVAIPFIGPSTALADEKTAYNLSTDFAAITEGTYQITILDTSIVITAGLLTRKIDFSNGKLSTTSLAVAGTELLSNASSEFKLTFYNAFPNAKPAGLKLTTDNKLTWADGTEASSKADNQPIEWKNKTTIDGNNLTDEFKIVSAKVIESNTKKSCLNIRARSYSKGILGGVFIDFYYEIYPGFPVIRKWIKISNNGNQWLKIDQFTIDDIDLSSAFRNVTPLTPEEQGAESSIISFSNTTQTCGIIAASEIPSAPRKITKNGAMGYSDEYFEWVLGPSESFASEPVFHFAYSGQVNKTSSATSTPLDRANEGPFQKFLREGVGLRGSAKDIPAPIWCSYSNFLTDLTDFNMREQADIAAKIGFTTFQLDEGWAKTPSPGGSEPDQSRFPDFEATCRYILNKGLRLGLWISCFRTQDSKDIAAIPDARSLPLSINSKRGHGMSFTSNWREYFVNDLLYMQDRYQMSYVKQDLTNISKGDIADHHESRTRKESLLRGLRGLLEVNKNLGEIAPALWTQITHEIYWRTPGPPADIAALKYACAFHTTPNTYFGAGGASKRVNPAADIDPAKLRAELIKSCAQARNRFYDHRGLPSYAIEFYAAHAVNIKGSLTSEVQDRQICSWLMGAPTVFAGDLSSLTAAHIAHYRKRFDLLKLLQHKHNIYNSFQHSGVPKPTDVDWHWWGKLDPNGYGAVVAIRGSAGKDTMTINIPWVNPKTNYKVFAHLKGRSLGMFSGKKLIDGAVTLNLPVYGQEILELAKA